MKAALCLIWLVSLGSIDARSVSLRVQPDQCVFEEKTSVSLSCEDSSGLWVGPGSVLRNSTNETMTRCGEVWGRRNGSVCRISRLEPKLDSGHYWCESEHGLTSEPLHITVTERLEQNVSTACPTKPSALPTTPEPSAPAPRPPLPAWTWPVLGSALGLLLVLVLVPLVLLVKRSRRRTEEQNGRPEELTYSELRVSHDRRRPIRRDQDSEPSPVYSTVKTQDVLYSSVRETRETKRSPVDSTVKTQDVIYSSVKKTRDPL